MKNNEEEFREKIRQLKDSPLARDIAAEEGVYVGDKKKVEWMTIFSFGFFIFILIFIAMGVYYVGQGKFQSIINQGDIQVNPLYNTTTNVEAPVTVDNNYDFKSTHNLTIINQVNCNMS